MSRPSTIEVAVYDADHLVAVGTVRSVAKELGVLENTIRYYLTPAYERKLARRKTLAKSRSVVRLGDDE